MSGGRSPERRLQSLNQALMDPQVEAGIRLRLAFSGGGDSSALLHALSRCDDIQIDALHVDHGLHPDSPRWAEHCIKVANDFGVTCKVLRVSVDADARGGLEAAAREARYAALCAELEPSGVLVLAHHRDDQAETLLLRLMRGSGSAGLSAMQRWSQRDGHRLWRPWLDIPRESIDEYRRQHGIPHLQDPANRDPRFARSHLRQTIFPALREHWPAADSALARSAALLADESERLARDDRRLLANVQGIDPDVLDASALRLLSARQRPAVLRAWLDQRGAPPIPARVIDRLDTDLLESDSTTGAKLHWPGASIRRHRDSLYLQLDRESDKHAPGGVDWDGVAPLDFAGWKFRFAGTASGGTGLGFHLDFGTGGERIRLERREIHRPVSECLREAGVPGWQREDLPLLWLRSSGGQPPILLAVADLLRSEQLSAIEAQLGGRLQVLPPSP